jgi:hypothetical protein
MNGKKGNGNFRYLGSVGDVHLGVWLNGGSAKLSISRQEMFAENSEIKRRWIRISVPFSNLADFKELIDEAEKSVIQEG